MREILPGIRHWTTFYDAIHHDVSSYYVEPGGVLIDPMVPEEGLDALADGGSRPQQIVLTSGNHTRHADRLAEAFAIPIRVSPEGAERIGGALDVELYHAGDDIAPGVRALHVGVLSPDEYALHLTATAGAVALADGAQHYGHGLAFFPDELLGDNPEAVKEGLRQAFRELLELDFEHLLFAHGDPLLRDGKQALRDFATRTA